MSRAKRPRAQSSKITSSEVTEDMAQADRTRRVRWCHTFDDGRKMDRGQYTIGATDDVNALMERDVPIAEDSAKNGELKQAFQAVGSSRMRDGANPRDIVPRLRYNTQAEWFEHLAKTASNESQESSDRMVRYAAAIRELTDQELAVALELDVAAAGQWKTSYLSIGQARHDYLQGGALPEYTGFEA